MISPKKILALATALLLPAAAAFAHYNNNGEIFMKEAASKEEKGDLAGALDSFGRALSNYQSYLQEETDDKDLADDHAKIDAINAKIADLNKRYSRELEAQGKYEEAAWRAGRNHNDPGDLIDAARLYYLSGDITHALRYAAKAIQLKPDFAEAHLLLGRAKFRDWRVYEALYIKGRGGFMMWEGPVTSEPFTDIKVDNVDLDGALDDLTHSLKLKPDDADALNCRGLVRYIEGDRQGALGDFSAAIKARGDLAAAWSNRAHAEFAAGDTKSALADLDKAIALQPGLAVAWGNRALAKQSTGDLDGALADIDKAISLKPDYLSAYHFRGILKSVKGDAAGADADFKKSGELADQAGSSNWQIFYNDPALVKQTLADMDGALADLGERMAVPAGDEKLKMAFARAYLASGKSTPGMFGRDDELADLDNAIALEPDFAEAYTARGLARAYRGYPVFGNRREFPDAFGDLAPVPAAETPDAYKQAQAHDRQLALADFAKAFQLTGTASAATYSAQASIKQQDGDSRGALADMDKAVALKPDDANLYNQRGTIKGTLGDEKGSHADILHWFDLGIAHSKTPQDSAAAYYDRAHQKLDWGDKAGALEDVEKSLAAAPEGYAASFYMRARIHYDAGKMETVLDDLDKALALNKNDHDSLYLRATIERDKKQWDVAVADFNAAFEAQQNDHDARREMALIEAAEGDNGNAWKDFSWALSEQFGELMNSGQYDYPVDAAQLAERQKQVLDGLASDIEKVAVFKKTKLSILLNSFAVQYSAVDSPYPAPWNWHDTSAPDEFTKLIALRPSMGALYFIRAHANFNLHAYADALADFRKTIELGRIPNGSLVDAHFFIWAIRTKTGDGKAANEELQAWSDGLKPGELDAWHSIIAQFLTGKINENTMRSYISNEAAGGVAVVPWRRDVWFYAGIKHLAEGDKLDAANRFYEGGMIPGDEQNNWHTEPAAASAELQLLQPKTKL